MREMKPNLVQGQEEEGGQLGAAGGGVDRVHGGFSGFRRSLHLWR